MDAEKVIKAIFSGKCYQIGEMRLTGCGEIVRVYVPRRGSCFLSQAETADFVRAAAAAGKCAVLRP